MMARWPRPPEALIAPARRVAYVVLRRTFEHGAYTDLALRAEAGALDARDRALAMALASGAVQRKATLDHLIAQLSERPAERLDAPLLAALRLGLYELLYMAGAPDYAVVHDAVELAKAHARAGHGLVNAVLRRAAREGPRSLLGALGDATFEQAAIKHSHPEWLARLWFEQLGAGEARALMARDNEPAELALRANTLVTDTDALARALPVASHRDHDIPEALVLDGPFDAQGSPAWGEGAFVAQSRAAMLVARVVAPLAGERVLDLCAAPGGKATHLAALMRGEGEVLAVERDQARARRLQQTAVRLRAHSVRVEVADAREAPREPTTFDRVLVDPPCSGLGTLQARPDLRWRASAEAIDEMAEAQSEILAAGAKALRPGGVLVYSTCTISATENEQVIAAFLDSHADFSLDDLAAELPAAAASGLPGAALTLPHRHRTAGFFIARLRRS
jgi:16S rRNA (cytosine967-C5)-methyltransferase